MLDEVRSHLMRSPRRARWADAPALTGEGDEKVISAAIAANPRKAFT